VEGKTPVQAIHEVLNLAPGMSKRASDYLLALSLELITNSYLKEGMFNG
jgi:hypothetical protein